MKWKIWQRTTTVKQQECYVRQQQQQQFSLVPRCLQGFVKGTLYNGKHGPVSVFFFFWIRAIVKYVFFFLILNFSQFKYLNVSCVLLWIKYGFMCKSIVSLYLNPIMSFIKGFHRNHKAKHCLSASQYWFELDWMVTSSKFTSSHCAVICEPQTWRVGDNLSIEKAPNVY